MASIIDDILRFQELTELGDYRTGYILAKNGMLIERIRGGGDIGTRTGEKIRANLRREVKKRKLDPSNFPSLESVSK